MAAIQKALTTPLPKSLDEKYEQIISSIDEVHQPEVMRALQALTVSVDHLTLEQVVEILAVDLDSVPPQFDPDARLLDPRSILTMCSSLVTSFKPRVWINKQDAPLALRLAHASVADYLTQRGTTTGFHFSKYSARQLLAQICLVYFLNPEFSDGHNRSAFERRNKNFPFLKHTAFFWPMYLDREGDSPVQELHPKTKELIKALFDTRSLPKGGNYACWVGQLIPSSSDTVIQNTPPLYYAASFGVVEVVRFLLDSEPDIEIDALGGRASSSPLQVSVYRDHIDVARILLERGADPNLPNKFEETTLHWAGIVGNREMTQLLLDYGADSSSASSRRRFDAVKRSFEAE
jgi:Ankyrin repeats (3 copies)